MSSSATWTTVDKKVEITRDDAGDVVISFKGEVGTVATRTIPAGEWAFIVKVLK